MCITLVLPPGIWGRHTAQTNILTFSLAFSSTFFFIFIFFYEELIKKKLSVGACEEEQIVSFAVLCRILASGNMPHYKMDKRDLSMAEGGARCKLCAAHMRVKRWGFFYLGEAGMTSSF